METIDYNKAERAPRNVWVLVSFILLAGVLALTALTVYQQNTIDLLQSIAEKRLGR